MFFRGTWRVPNLTSLVQPGLHKCLLWNGWKVMEKSHFLQGKLSSASDGVLLKCSHQDMGQRRWKLYAKELHSSGEAPSGFPYPVTDRCSLCPAGCEDPQFANPCDRSCHSTCCDYCASGGNVTKLEEPDQNLPAPGSYEPLGACSTEAAQEGVYSRWRIKAGGAGKSLYFSDYPKGSPGLCDAQCQLWAAQAQDNCTEVFTVAKDWWSALDPGTTPLSQYSAPVGWRMSGGLALKSSRGGPHLPPLAKGKLGSLSKYSPHTIASVKASAFPIISQLFL